MSIVNSPDPDFIQELWTILQEEVFALHDRWNIYQQLYGTSAQRVDLLNASDRSLFKSLQITILHDIQLTLSNLSDPAETNKHKNLSLNALIEKLRSNNETILCERLNDPVETFNKSCSDLRERRNKFIGHFDLSTKINSMVTPIFEASRAEIKEALCCLRNAMLVVENYYGFSKIPYETDFTSAGKNLILSLMQAHRYRELVENGTVPNEDFDSRL